MITIESRPAPLQLELDHTAVVVVDMQNDFAARGGMFDRAGIDLTGIRTVIQPIAFTLDAARAASIPVVYLKMGYRPDLSDLGTEDSPNRVRHLMFRVGQSMQAPDGTQGRFLLRDTWNTEIIPELAPKPGDTVIYKTRYSGFYQTELDAILKRAGAKYLVVTGCTTSVCVESTVRDAMFRDYSCVVLEDCVAEAVGSEFSRTNHDASLLVLERLFGWVTTSAALVQAIAGRRAAATAPVP
jgi:ureidoacrylate peracid hydrolase